MKYISFYKYVNINEVEVFCKEHLAFCNFLGLKGKVLVAPEGINGCLTGEDEAIRTYEDSLCKDPRFIDVEFKEAFVKKHAFLRMLVKPRKEIITSFVTVFPAGSSTYIEPEALKTALDKGEEIILLDARNDFEYELGKFKGAHHLDLLQFSDFPKVLKKIEHLKNKKIVTYCTGGVRCEKFSSYLREQGFSQTYQLHGGIIKYGEVCGDTHFEGKCFVFDRRGAIEINPAKQTQEEHQCGVCFLPQTKEYFCNHCHERFFSCEKCLTLLEYCCSKMCRNILRKEKF